MKIITVLVVQALTVAAASAQSAAFYRIASTNQTRIIACDPRNALLMWTNAAPGGCCAVERAGRLGGPWSSDFPHTVVANAGCGGAAVVSLGGGVLWDTLDRGPVLTLVTNAIRIGTKDYRIEAFLWLDMFPPVDPRRGIIATVSLIETNGFPIPDSMTIPRFRVFNGAQQWNVYAPSRMSGTPPSVLAVRGGDGPVWAYGTRVDVVVEVASGNVRYLLKAADQAITAAW